MFARADTVFRELNFCIVRDRPEVCADVLALPKLLGDDYDCVINTVGGFEPGPMVLMFFLFSNQSVLDGNGTRPQSERPLNSS